MTGRTFAYCRVSTTEQTTQNQILAIRNAGYDVIDSRVISETVSGSTKTTDREQFSNLIEHKIEAGDTLVVLKLDRLGRTVKGLVELVNQLHDRKVNFKSVTDNVDTSTPSGRFFFQLLWWDKKNVL